MSTARRTALVSLVAAVVLVVVKAVVGFASGSLGVLAEAAHSGIDAVAAVLTLYAVGVAERPPDREHPYGHGKAQHLAALGEAAFLAGAAIWIAIEAVVRLRNDSSPVDPRPYVFAVILFVLAVDASRATLSLKQGRRERNAALIANAWHFGSDFVGTLAVLVGLVLAAAGVPGGDSVAAIFVAVIVLVAAVRLAAGNVDVLMDRAPLGLAGIVEQAVRGVAGVVDVRSVRVREAGGESFADVVIGVSRLDGLEKMHDTIGPGRAGGARLARPRPGAGARRAGRPRRGARPTSASRPRRCGSPAWWRRTTSRCSRTPPAAPSRCTCACRRTRPCARPPRCSSG